MPSTCLCQVLGASTRSRRRRARWLDQPAGFARVELDLVNFALGTYDAALKDGAMAAPSPEALQVLGSSHTRGKIALRIA